MTSRDFCYWLQGFMEVGNPSEMSPGQIATIQNHLNMVFFHEIDPSMGPDSHQDHLQHLHDKPQDPNKPLMRC